MRAFVAVEMSQPIRDDVGRLIERLRRAGGPVKWVAPANLHLTLKFLGEIGEDAVPRAIAILRECIQGVAPFALSVRGAGAFPTPARPRVLFVDAHDEPPCLANIAKRLDKAMTAIGVPREKRKFRNHVTIGRVRKPSTAIADMADELGKATERSFGTMTVEEVVLMKSDLRPDGPVYTPVERVALKTSA